MKRQVHRMLRRFGFDVFRVPRGSAVPPPFPAAGSPKRPIGDVELFFEDVRARGLPVRSMLDVGANRGKWARMATHYFPDAKVFMIEPLEEMRPHLDEFCRLHSGSRWFHAGAGASAGELTLTIYDDLDGSSLLHPEEAGKLGSGRQRRVPIITIDSLIEKGDIELPQLVKLDVQGFELEALRGATRLFGAAELIIMEVSLFPLLGVNPVFHDVIQFMEERNYLLYDVCGYCRRPLDGALAQVDAVFAKRDGFLRQSSEWEAR
ncbi:MAG: FkbM family methyltransferase [Tepidisphaeraceae bacterium]